MLPFSTYPVVLLYNLYCPLVLSLWFYYITNAAVQYFPCGSTIQLILPFRTFPVVLLYNLYCRLVLSLWFYYITYAAA